MFTDSQEFKNDNNKIEKLGISVVPPAVRPESMTNSAQKHLISCK